ncbi:MAG: hypothetical protein Q4B57_05005 [Eubacteriales bacterium]|nr:hypothetical protein [Eubacteriales bacterium]
MTKLMKYEWRKALFPKMVLLVITAIAEIAFLIGIFSKKEMWYGLGIEGLVLCAIFGILYIGIESLTTFSKDLNTKQSYMLFLTPHTSYEILGSKVLMNAISIFVTGAFFAVLAIVDIGIGVASIGGVKELLSFAEAFMSVKIDWNNIRQIALMAFSSALVSWLNIIVVGYLAILLSATVLAGKKGSRVVSFVIFLIISGISSYVVNLVTRSMNEIASFWCTVGCMLIFTVIFYAITGWIMDKKLSV